MNPDEQIIRWIFRGNLVIFLVVTAVALTGWSRGTLTFTELGLFFVAGLANASGRFASQEVGSQALRVVLKTSAFGCILGAFLFQAFFYPGDLTVIGALCCFFALLSGILILSCIFRNHAAMPMIKKIRQLYAERSQRVSAGVPPPLP